MSKVCARCKWYGESASGILPVCRSPNVPPNQNLVTGEKSYSFCMVQRGFDHEDTCSAEGKFFEKEVFTAETKRHDPDEENSQDFNTLKEAFAWLEEQRAYGIFRMWINNENVVLFNEKLIFESERP